MNRSIIGLLLGLGCIASQGLQAQDAAKVNAARINSYIQGLRYDRRALLAIRPPDPSTSLAARTPGDKSVILCSNIAKTLNGELHQVDILSPAASLIYPGALVKANSNLTDGKPDIVTLPRAPMTLYVDLPRLGSKGQVVINNANQGNVRTAISNIEEIWFSNPSNVQPSRQSYQVKKAYSASQVSLSLGFNVKWGLENSVQVDSSVASKAKKSTAIALFKQIYYTAGIDIPESPASVLAPSVPLTQVMQTFDDRNPPAFVRSVDYGRIILVRLDAESSETEADLSGAMTLATSGVTVDATMEAKYKNIIKNSTLTVVTIGGNAQATSAVFKGGEASIKALPGVIKSGATFSAKNPAYPIAYTVHFLKDNTQALYTYSANYVENECKEYPNGFVEVRNSSGCAVRWHVSWWEVKNGKDVPVWHETGSCGPGWNTKWHIPGDAREIWIVGEYVGFLGWRSFLNVTLPRGPDNHTYIAKGTAFNCWNDAVKN